MYISPDSEKLVVLKDRELLNPKKKKRARVTAVSELLDPFIPG
jgi:hypothetical protein